MSWLSPSIVIPTNSSPEVNVINKFFKKQFPFVVEVSGFSFETSYRKESLILDIYVSPEHFCELMDGRVEKKVVEKIRKISSSFIKTVLTEFSMDILNIRFFPVIVEATILKSLEDIVVEF